jgi:dienelactone hydrolase
MHGRLFVAVLALLATLHAARAEGDVARSWDRAIVYLPGATGATTMAKLGQASLAQRAGAVIFMHGCNGIDGEVHGWAALLAGMGLVVIAPDSLARTDRKVSCDAVKLRAGFFPPVNAMRLDEIRYAAEQVRRQPWFDGKTLFLMGYSEGAIAAVRTRLGGFRGVIATSWTCTSASPAFDGVFTPAGTPVLTMMHASDPWYPDPSRKGSCARKIAGRKHARHVEVPGHGHGTSGSEVARKAVAEFVTANRAAP